MASPWGPASHTPGHPVRLGLPVEAGIAHAGRDGGAPDVPGGPSGPDEPDNDERTHPVGRVRSAGFSG